ncbi:uncharacterized protein LOC127808858 [Diospyros lotus]|uniref:uncharacterized protein LOC127808858 n=1 Tax=Diospyros lotus TaxID=55363 RepID=UPI0022532344|nr:uncharacterized protein LOC127808858 [Diospyros lotus]
MRFTKFSHYSGSRPSPASLSLYPISMASSAKLISLLFFLALLSSLRAHARESKFFSKATAAATNANESTAAEVIPNKEQEALSKQGQEPSFIPDTQNGYGLYGHEPEQLPPTTAAATTTSTNNNNENYYNNGASNYNTQKQGMSDTRFLENGKYFYDMNSEKNYNPNGFQKSRGVVDYSSSNNNFYNGGANGFNTQQHGLADTQLMGGGYTAAGADAATNRYYNTQKQGMSDTRFLENGKYYYDINGEKTRAVDEYNKNNNYNYHNGGNGYNSQRQQQDFTNSDIYNAGGDHYGEPQGMSDTRFMENGKYYYDPNGESSRGVEYSNRKGYYGNNGNTYEYRNSMEGYQNQQEEFQEGEEEEYVP